MKPSVRTVENAYVHRSDGPFSALVQPADFKAFTAEELAALVSDGDLAVVKLEYGRVLVLSTDAQIIGHVNMHDVSLGATRDLFWSNRYDTHIGKPLAMEGNVYGRALVCPAAMLGKLVLPVLGE